MDVFFSMSENQNQGVKFSIDQSLTIVKMPIKLTLWPVSLLCLACIVGQNFIVVSCRYKIKGNEYTIWSPTLHNNQDEPLLFLVLKDPC